MIAESLVEIACPSIACPSIAWIHQLAEDVLAEFDTWRSTPHADACRDELRSHMKRVSAFNVRRCLQTAEELLTTNNAFGQWAAKLFLSFRDKTAMTDYLRFQEWAFATDTTDPLRDLNANIREAFSDLGKGATMRIGLGVQLWKQKRLKFGVGLDPFVNYRAMYLRLLRSFRKRNSHRLIDKAVFLFHRTLIQTKFWIAEKGCEKYYKYAVDRLKLQPNWIPANILRHCEVMTRDLLAQSSGFVDLDAVETELSEYMQSRISSLSEAVPQDILDRGGASKFFKVWIGVLIGRLSTAKDEQADLTHYAITSFKLAFCWACTYPLIDDILDASETSSETKSQLIELMQCVFADAPEPRQLSNRSCTELFERMKELAELTPPSGRAATKQAILNVFEAHVQDAKLDLHDALASPKERLKTSLLKSMLVRIATMHICGIIPTEQDYREMAPIAIFNQLGDDIWDAGEDFSEGRATPVTVGMRSKEFDPHSYYLDFAAYLTTLGRVGRPAALAVSHTYRLAWESGDSSTRQRLVNSLISFFPSLNPCDFFRGTQHVDPDSLIFDFEKAVSELVSN